MYIHVNKQLVQVKQDTEAIHLLYEAMQGYLVEGFMENHENINRNGCLYDIIWSENDEHTPEVCVRYQNSFKKDVNRCKTIE